MVAGRYDAPVTTSIAMQRFSVPLPWRDRAGKLSVLKAVVFVALLVPGTINLGLYLLGMLGARPLTELIHGLGLWTIRLLLITLAISPLRFAWRAPRLLIVRRMLGVAAFAYGASHLVAYIGDQSFNLVTVAGEIVKRFYLTIGFAALLILTALAATSTDAMVRRLGGERWQTLHRLAYAAAALGVVHYFIQAKADVWEPTVAVGVVLWLMGYRLITRSLGTARAASLPMLALLDLAAAALTALGEASYFNLYRHVPIVRVLDADLSLVTGVRPCWVVLGIGTLVCSVAGLVRIGPVLWDRFSTLQWGGPPRPPGRAADKG